jgi:hypothetical protein
MRQARPTDFARYGLRKARAYMPRCDSEALNGASTSPRSPPYSLKPPPSPGLPSPSSRGPPREAVGSCARMCLSCSDLSAKPPPPPPVVAMKVVRSIFWPLSFFAGFLLACLEASARLGKSVFTGRGPAAASCSTQRARKEPVSRCCGSAGPATAGLRPRESATAPDGPSCTRRGRLRLSCPPRHATGPSLLL